MHNHRQALLTSVLAGLIVALIHGAGAPSVRPDHVDDFQGRPRVVVLSDIGNEPDDQMSLVRLLLYSNEIDIEALIATEIDVAGRTRSSPTPCGRLVAAYGEVRANLLRHAPGWPKPPRSRRWCSRANPPMEWRPSAPTRRRRGAEAIIRPLTNPIRARSGSRCGAAPTRSPRRSGRCVRPVTGRVEKFVGRLRVSSDSPTRGTTPVRGIRREFPSLFYFVISSSRPDSGNYASATWTGISGTCTTGTAPAPMAARSPTSG